MNERIQAQHLSRKAVLYVRQSSLHQVAHNEESRRLQYAMQAHLRQLGWNEIEVVDEDQGRSAADPAQRSGFEQMVAEVCLGRVGAVAARELSRFARNSREWQQLVEVCRVVDTLLIDQETIYDARRGNDRLLLGLKGSLNEYELDILRLRSVEARHAKARRGELIIIAPVGYIKTDEGRLEKDPDRRVQEALGLVFQKCLELGSARQTLMWFLEHELELPSRRHGTGGWETVWRRPKYGTLVRILQNPVYAGFYVYGKTVLKVEFRNGVSRKVRQPRPKGEWVALLPDHHEGYIRPEMFERIQEMFVNNTQGPKGSGVGAPKRGAALLTGILRCGRCGRKLTVAYTGQAHNVQRYICRRGQMDHGEPRCISVSGRQMDRAVSGELLRVLRPAALEAALEAGRAKVDQDDEVLRALALDLEAANYEAERAWKQFDAVDPANRLVADTLERRWNEALERKRDLEEKIEEETVQRNHKPPPSLEIFKTLAQDFSQVWKDPRTDMCLKKRLVRALIEEVILDVDAEAREDVLVIHWAGGVHTERRIPRRRRGQNRCQTSTETVEAIRRLALICTDDAIAITLTRNGLRTGRGNRWTRERVASFRSDHKIPRHCPQRKAEEGWMNLTEASAYVGVSTTTLRIAVERGEIEGLHPLADGPWVLKREHLDQPGAVALVQRVRRRREQATEPISGEISLFESIT